MHKLRKRISCPTLRSPHVHTRRELTPDQAKNLVSHPNISVVKAQAAALSLHPWGNTPEEWLRLEACLVLIEERRRGP
jgi:hypothetical protein